MTTPGRPYLVAGYGDLGQMTDLKLACTYFNGTRLVTRVYHYSPANNLGRDACPSGSMSANRRGGGPMTEDRKRLTYGLNTAYDLLGIGS